MIAQVTRALAAIVPPNLPLARRTPWLPDLMQSTH